MCSQKDTNVYSRHLDILIVSRYPYENTQTMQLCRIAGKARKRDNLEGYEPMTS